MDFYVSSIRMLRNYDNHSKFTRGDSIIIKFKDKDYGKVRVRRGVILRIGTQYLYLRVTKEHWNNKHNSCWWYEVKIRISDIQVIKHFKNVLDEVKQ